MNTGTALLSGFTASLCLVAIAFNACDRVSSAPVYSTCEQAVDLSPYLASYDCHAVPYWEDLADLVADSAKRMIAVQADDRARALLQYTLSFTPESPLEQHRAALGELYFLSGRLARYRHDLDSAQYFFQQSLGLFDPISHGAYLALQALGGLYFFNLREKDQGYDFFEKSLQVALNLPGISVEDLVNAFYHAGIGAQSQRAAHSGLELQKVAMLLLEEKGSEDPWLMPTICAGLGSAYFALDSLDQAAVSYEKALNNYRQLNETRDAIFCANNLATIYMEAGKMTEADSLFEGLYQMAITQQGYRLADLFLMCYNQALFWKKEKNWRRTQRWFDRAYTFFEAGLKDRDLKARYHLEYASYCEERQWSGQRAAHLDSAVFALTDSLPDDLLFSADFLKQVSLPGLLAQAFNLIADGHWQAARKGVNVRLHLERVLQYGDQALNLEDQLRRRLDNAEDQMRLNAREGALNLQFSRNINAAYQLYLLQKDSTYLAHIFRNMERNRAMVLLDRLQQQAELSTLNPGPQTQVHARAWQDSLVWLATRLAKWQTQGDTPPMEEYIFLKQTEQRIQLALDTWKDQVRAGMKAQQTELTTHTLASLSEAQAFARKEDLWVMEYFLEDRRYLHLLAISGSNIQVAKIKLEPDFFQHLQTYLAQISRPIALKRDWEAYTEAAHVLYQGLLGPLDSLLQHQDKGLLILAGGDLGILPFEALLTEAAQAIPLNFRKLSYLAGQRCIQYAPSFSVLQMQIAKARTQPPALGCLGMAFSEPGNLSRQTRTEGQAALPFSGHEVNEIARYVEGKFVKGPQATKRWFLSQVQDSDKFGLLHLAIHGAADKGYPRLIFRGGEEKLDSVLYLHEVYNARIQAEMVVLSACETGTGEHVPGEGILNLARGFIEAGAASVVTTRWRIADVQSAQLMGYFYAHLAAGNRKDKALQEAIKAYLVQADFLQAQPFYWAAYLAQGDMRAVNFRQAAGAPTN